MRNADFQGRENSRVYAHLQIKHVQWRGQDQIFFSLGFCFGHEKSLLRIQKKSLNLLIRVLMRRQLKAFLKIKLCSSVHSR